MIGLVRISIIRSAILPDGSINVAETDWLSNTSFEGSAGGIMLILRAAINAVGATKLMLETGMRRMPAVINPICCYRLPCYRPCVNKSSRIEKGPGPGISGDGINLQWICSKRLEQERGSANKLT